MVALLTPACRATASMLVASMPRSAIRARAALRTSLWARVLLGRGISDLDSGEQVGGQRDERRREDSEDDRIEAEAEVGPAGEGSAQSVDAVGQWVDVGDPLQNDGKV